MRFYDIHKEHKERNNDRPCTNRYIFLNGSPNYFSLFKKKNKKKISTKLTKESLKFLKISKFIHWWIYHNIFWSNFKQITYSTIRNKGTLIMHLNIQIFHMACLKLLFYSFREHLFKRKHLIPFMFHFIFFNSCFIHSKHMLSAGKLLLSQHS